MDRLINFTLLGFFLILASFAFMWATVGILYLLAWIASHIV
jgi:hypothetical protein